jgi:hypothetical protein
MHSAILEGQPRIAHDVADGAGDEHFTGRRVARDLGRDFDRGAGEDRAIHRALAGVEAGGHRHPEARRGLGEGGRAADGAGRTVEGVDDLVARRLERAATEPVAFTGGVIEERIDAASVDPRVKDRREDAIQRWQLGGADDEPLDFAEQRLLIADERGSGSRHSVPLPP